MLFNLFSLLSKTTALIFRYLKLGTGTTIVSNLYIKLFPKNINFDSFKFTKGVIFITGTNGKTSTSKIMADTLNFLGFRVLHNKTGGNILRSILGMFLLQNNKVKNNEYDFLVLEVDEASLLDISKYFLVDVLVILNFSRDQLDRYFEIENITSNIKKFLISSPDTSLVYNSEDIFCEEIANSIKNNKITFKKNLDLLTLSNLNDDFMAYNLDAVVRTMAGYGYTPKDYISALRNIKKPYGRGEEVIFDSIKYTIYLAKNPSSFNSTLESLIKQNSKSDILYILNDNTPDGTDISWIYDIEPDLLHTYSNNKNIFFSGKRAFEMAQRVSVTMSEKKIFIANDNLKSILTLIKKSKLSKIDIICNYSAMLEIRKILTGRNIL